MKNSLLNLITYEGKAFADCTAENRGIIVVIAGKLENLEQQILQQADTIIDISANRITVSGLNSSLKTKVLDCIYKK